MAHLKKWAAVAAAVASVSLAGVIGMAPVLAGAAPSNDAIRHSIPTASPVVKFKPGTYEWYNNGADVRDDHCREAQHFHQLHRDTDRLRHVGPVWPISRVCTSRVASTFLATASSPEKSAQQARQSRARASRVTGSAPVTRAGPSTSPRCPPDPVRRRRTMARFTRSGALPIMAGPIVLGTYNWVVDGDYSGNITFASGDTYTSTLSSDDSGSWVQGGNVSRPDCQRRQRRGWRLLVRRQEQRSRDGDRKCQHSRKLGLPRLRDERDLRHQLSSTGARAQRPASHVLKRRHGCPLPDGKLPSGRLPGQGLSAGKRLLVPCCRCSR